MAESGAVQRARFMVAGTVPRGNLISVVERLQRQFGAEVKTSQWVSMRFGDRRSVWERFRPSQETKRWCHAVSDPQTWWKQISEGTWKEAGGGGPRCAPNLIRQAALVTIDDPTLPTAILLLAADFIAPSDHSLERRELYMTKWTLQDWLREFIHEDEARQHPPPVSVTYFECALPPDHSAIEERILGLEDLYESTASDARDERKRTHEDIHRALPFGMGDSRNERCSHFVGTGEGHASMGEWGFMTGAGQRSWLIQIFGGSIGFLQIPFEPQQLSIINLEMPSDPGKFIHIEPPQFILPLLAERWLLDWMVRARELESSVGKILDELSDAEPAEVVAILRQDAWKALAERATARYARQVVHRRVAPGLSRLTDERKGPVVEVPGFPVDDLWRYGETFEDARVLYRLGRDLAEMLQEAEELQERLDEDLEAATTTMAAVAQVELSAKQERASAAMNRLTWVMLLFTLVTTIAAVVSLSRP